VSETRAWCEEPCCFPRSILTRTAAQGCSETDLASKRRRKGDAGAVRDGERAGKGRRCARRAERTIARRPRTVRRAGRVAQAFKWTPTYTRNHIHTQQQHIHTGVCAAVCVCIHTYGSVRGGTKEMEVERGEE
jgi:hypothetical protein